MKLLFAVVLIVAIIIAKYPDVLFESDDDKDHEKHSFYDFSAKTIDGEEVSMASFKGKVLVVVNVASKCGLTPSMYPEMSQMKQKFKDQPFEIIAFPCNQFGSQEQGLEPEIKQFATQEHGFEGLMMSKIDVNGPKAHPLYKFMRAKQTGLFGSSIKWNFTKFLISAKGEVIRRYGPSDHPMNFAWEVERELAKINK